MLADVADVNLLTINNSNVLITVYKNDKLVSGWTTKCNNTPGNGVF